MTAATESTTKPRPHVLVVDDRPENLFAFRAALEAVECEVHTAASGAAGIAESNAREHALVLVDLLMPDMDGVEVATSIRNSDAGRDTAVVLVTAADVDDATTARAYRAGIADFLRKPVDPSVLAAKVRVFSELWSARHQVREQIAKEVDRERLYAVFANVPAALVVYEGPELRVAFANRAFESLYGGRELTGLSVTEASLIGERGLQALTEARVSDAARVTLAHEAVVLSKSGERQTRFYDWTLQPLHDAPFGDAVLSIAVDVTDAVLARRAAEEAEKRALESEARQRVLVERLTRLQSAVGALAGATSAADVVDALVGKAFAALGADTCTMYAADGDDRLVLVGQRGVPLELLGALSVITPSGPFAPLTRTIFAETAAEYAEWFPAVSSHAASGPRARAFWSVPLRARGAFVGVLAMGYHQEHRFDDEERAYIEAFAQQCAVALDRARTYDEEHARSDRLRITASVSRLLSTSLDYETTLSNVAHSLVPELGDWCTVDILQENGLLELVALAHVDPTKIESGRAFRRAFPPKPDEPRGLYEAIRTCKSQLFTHVTKEMLASAARSDEHLAALRDAGLESLVLVPMCIGERALGVLTLVSANPSRRYGPADLGLLEDLASRAALAVENARLHLRVKSAVRLRDDFLAIASHELRTPLATLQLRARGLQKRVERGEGAADYLEKIQKQVSRLDELVSRLLDVSRLNAGEPLGLDVREIDLAEVVREVLDDSSELLSRGGMKIEARLTEVRGTWDPERMRELVANLVLNAAKYAPRSELTVTLDREGDRARLVVADGGPGIKSEARARVFDRFARANTGPGGFGVGLWLCRRIAEAHGGSIRLDERVTSGATFVVELPVAPG